MSKCITITKDNFEAEVLQSTVPVLLDFWAAWCGPCRNIAPVMDQLSEEYEGRIKAGKVNVDEEQDLAARHSISSIPALIVYNKGEIVTRTTGAAPKQNIEALFKDIIN